MSFAIAAEASIFASIAFSASGAYQSFKDSIASSDAEQFEMRSFCLVNKVGFYDRQEGEEDVLLVLPRFETRARLVVTRNDDATWIKFFEEFGTHYVNEIQLGGRYTHRYTMDSS